MRDVLNSFRGTTCEVKTMSNQLLLYGRVYKFIEEQSLLMDMVSVDKDDAMPLIPYNTPVKIVLRKGDDMMVIGGNIYICNEKFWRVSNILEFQNFERRGFFRVSTAAKGLVSSAKKDAGTDQLLFEAHLVNISLSGVMFTTDHRFEKFMKICLHSVCLAEDIEPFHLLCKIVSVEERDGFEYRYQYRCSFEQMEARCSDLLCKAIFELQRESIRKMRSRVQ